MLIKINVSDAVVDIFKGNLNTINQGVEAIYSYPAIIKAVIHKYLNDSIDRDDLDMFAAQYLKGLEESGELDDIVYESTLK